MRRLFWVSLGAVAGVLVVRKLTRTAQTYTPAGLAAGLENLGDAIRDFADQVSAGMAERELELRDALGLDEQHDLPADVAADLSRHPTKDWKGER
jgi:hypothetical protein